MNKKLKFKGIHEAVHEVATVSDHSSYMAGYSYFYGKCESRNSCYTWNCGIYCGSLLLTRFHRPLILNDLIAFANQYESLEKRLLDDLALPYAIMDTNGRMIWSNKVFAELTGKEQLYNKHITTIFPEITPDKLPVPEKQEITEMSTNFGDRIYRVSMQLVTMKDVVNEARILENVDADINLVAMFFYDETELSGIYSEE